MKSPITKSSVSSFAITYRPRSFLECLQNVYDVATDA